MALRDPLQCSNNISLSDPAVEECPRVQNVEWKTLITAKFGALAQFVQDLTRRPLFFFAGTYEVKEFIFEPQTAEMKLFQVF